jgi:rRNA maturation endonuclease Nob1
MDRRRPGSGPLRPGALRCEDCGTTWFDQLAAVVVHSGRRCRRCGGRLHTERRKSAGGEAAAA